MIRSLLKKSVLRIAERIDPFVIDSELSLQPFNTDKSSNQKTVIGISEHKPLYSAFTLHNRIHPHLQRFIPEFEIPPLSAIQAFDAHIYTKYGDIIFRNHDSPIFGDFRQDDKNEAIRLSRFLPCFINTKEGASILLIQSNMWWQNYFHWTLDYLTKIIWARRLLGAHCQLNAIYITSERTFAYQHDSLRYLGLTSKSNQPCFYFGRLMHARAANLIVVQERYDIQTINPEIHNNTIHPSIINELASEYIQNLNLSLMPPKDRSPQRIYISRNNAPNRRIINEQEITDYLRNYDFQIVRLETLSFRQQVELFAAASIVIGVHGAGLTNIAYTTKCCVLELFVSNHRHGAEYLQLTNIRQGFYLYHILDSANDQNDVVYPLPLLSDHLGTMLEQECCNTTPVRTIGTYP